MMEMMDLDSIGFGFYSGSDFGSTKMTKEKNWSEPGANLTLKSSAFFKAEASMEHEFHRDDC